MDDAPRRPVLVIVLASFMTLVALLYGASAALILSKGFSPLGGALGSGVGALTTLSLILAAAAIPAAVGMWLVKSWGWWLSVFVTGVALLLNLKFLHLAIGSINWDHPDALRALLTFFGPSLLSVAAPFILLMLTPVRIAMGISSKPRERRRRVVRAPRTPRRSAE